MKKFSSRKAPFTAIVAGLALGAATAAPYPTNATEIMHNMADLLGPHPYAEELKVLPRRHLHESSPDDRQTITVVKTFQELKDAWAAGAAHIELVSHMNSEGFPLLESEINGGTFSHVLPPQLESTRTIRGNCIQPPGEDITGVLSGEPLADLKDGQCVILGNQHLMPVVTGAVLISNIYLRYNAPIRGSFVGELQPQAAAVPVLFHSHGGKAWAEHLTVQGDGVSPCGGIVVYSAGELKLRDLILRSLYAANTTAGPKPIALARQASRVSFLRARVLNNKQDPGVPIIAGDSGVKLKFQECEFENNSLPLRIKVVPGAEVYSDNRTELVWPDTPDPNAKDPGPALPLSILEGTGTFLNSTNPIYLALYEGTPLPDTGDDSGSSGGDGGSEGDNSILSNAATIAISIAVSMGALLCACIAACLFLRHKRASSGRTSSPKNGRNGDSATHSLRKHMGMHDRSSTTSSGNPHRDPSTFVSATSQNHSEESSATHPRYSDPHAPPHALSGLHYAPPPASDHPYYKAPPAEPGYPAHLHSKYDAAAVAAPVSHASFASAHSYGRSSSNPSDPGMHAPSSLPRSMHAQHAIAADVTPSRHIASPSAATLKHVSAVSMAANSTSTPSTQNTPNMRIFQNQGIVGPQEPDSALARPEETEGSYSAIRSPQSAPPRVQEGGSGKQDKTEALRPERSWGHGAHDSAASSQQKYDSDREVTDIVGIGINGGKLQPAVSTPPPPNASMHEKIEFLHCQLDSLRNRQVLSGLLLQDGGGNRLVGGQAIVQFATHALSKVEYAIKFFLSNDAFLDEYGQYRDSASPLRAFLPRARDIVPNDDGAFVDARGHALPPCIVMEKGESLDRWVQRNRRVMDPFTCMQILYHVCECLTDLHSEGFVHRDLKPANVMWLPSQNRWTIIDFGCAARINCEARMGFSLMYAAPEVANAVFRQQQSSIIATTAMDAWSVGILAVELFTGRPALRLIEGRDKVVKQIVGEAPLPWENADGGRELLRRAGKLRSKLLQLLARDPAERLTVAAFVHSCSNMLNTTTQQSLGSRESSQISSPAANTSRT